MTAEIGVDVQVNPNTFEKTLVFSQPVTRALASSRIFGNPGMAAVLTPAAGEREPCKRFRLDSRDGMTVMKLKPDIRDQIMKKSLITTKANPFDLPPWVPASVIDQIKKGAVPQGVKRFPTMGDWGDVVVWRQGEKYELYQDFPESAAFYQSLTSDKSDARILRTAYMQFNKDMREFVDGRRLSPDMARSEIRRINDEVLMLILEGVVGIMSAGAAMTQVSAVMRQSADGVVSAASRSPRFKMAEGIAGERPFNGTVNVGGGGEVPGVTNLNPIKAGSGGPSTGIPNHVLGGMEDMSALFEPGSVKKMISNRLRFVDIRWGDAARSAAKAMAPGGEVSMNVWCNSPAEQKALVDAFIAAGFKNVKTLLDGSGTILRAVR